MGEQNKGFLLTTKSRDMKGRHVLSYFGKSIHGPFELRIENEYPVFFIHQDATFDWPGKIKEKKDLDLKTFANVPVSALYFYSLQEAFDCRDYLKEQGVRTFEADVRTSDRFLMERFIKGFVEFYADHVTLEKGVKVYHNPKVRSCEPFDLKLSTLSIDIETSRGSDLYSIGIHYKDSLKEVRKVFMVGNATCNKTIENSEIIYCDSEKSCYLKFEREFHLLDPDLVLGWHVVGFDFLFLEKKCQKWGIELALGRGGGFLRLRENPSRGWTGEMSGRCIIDGPPVLRGNFFSFENFKLDTVAHEILGRNKDITQTGMEKVAEIERRFVEDKHALAFYNLEDCILVTEIFEETKILDLLMARVSLSGPLFDRVNLSTVAFDYFLLPLIHRKKLVAPNILEIDRGDHAAGGLVLEPKVGLHENIFVFDFKSLYPTIIRTFKIDPYSRLRAEVDPLETPTGHEFSKTENLLPLRLEELMRERKKAKEVNDHALSQAIKILMNSFYGVMGTVRCRFYHSDLPQAVTGTGRWLLKKLIECIENHGHEVVYGDTDSVFVKIIDPATQPIELSKKLTKELADIIKLEFSLESFLELEFEKKYNKFFLPKARLSESGAKKKYVGLLDKGEREEISFSGMEYVRSDWTKLAKNFQLKLFQKFLSEESVDEFIKGTIDDLNSGIFDEDLTYHKRLSKKLEEYTKSKPPHVQAAFLLKENNLPIPKIVEYKMTVNGPVPLELSPSNIDYDHYREKQIRPLADVVLDYLNLNFDELFGGGQLDFFS